MVKHEYTNVFIAFLDILGFKNMVGDGANKGEDELTCEEIYNIYSLHLKKPLDNIYYSSPKIMLRMEDVHMTVMSDSICFYIDSSIENAFVRLVATCAVFQAELLRLNNPVLLRGGISHGGLFTNHKSILYGPGLVKAVVLESQYAKYPRIIIDKATCELGMKNTTEEIQNHLYTLIFIDHIDNESYHVINCMTSFWGIDTDNIHYCRLLSFINKKLDSLSNDTNKEARSLKTKYSYLKCQLNEYYLAD